MARNVVQKTTNRSTIKTKTQQTKSVQFTRTATRFEQLTDTTFGNLAERTTNGILVYDSTADKFVLIDNDDILSSAAADGNLPDDFIAQVEDEINLGAIAIESLDGGSF